jgi:hypothetical protein
MTCRKSTIDSWCPISNKTCFAEKTSFLGLIQSAMFAATGELYLIYPNNQPFQAPWLSCLWCLGRLSGKRQVISLLLRDLCIYFSLFIYIYIYICTHTYIYIYTCVCMCMYVSLYIYIFVIIYIYIYVYAVYTAYIMYTTEFSKGQTFLPDLHFGSFQGCLCISQKNHPFRTVVQTAKCPVSTGLISLWHCNFI